MHLLTGMNEALEVDFMPMRITLRSCNVHGWEVTPFNRLPYRWHIAYEYRIGGGQSAIPGADCLVVMLVRGREGGREGGRVNECMTDIHFELLRSSQMDMNHFF